MVNSHSFGLVQFVFVSLAQLQGGIIVFDDGFEALWRQNPSFVNVLPEVILLLEEDFANVAAEVARALL